MLAETTSYPKSGNLIINSNKCKNCEKKWKLYKEPQFIFTVLVKYLAFFSIDDTVLSESARMLKSVGQQICNSCS